MHTASSDLLPYFVLGAVSIFASFILTPAIRFFAKKIGAIDYPSERRINQTPIPRMGGIAIFIALVAALLVSVYGMKKFGWGADLLSYTSVSINHKLLAAAFCIVFLTGVLDDIFHLPPILKLAGQILAACIASMANLVVGSIINPFSGNLITLGWLTYPVTVIYLVSFANIINLIDGLDGLATGITAISSITMFLLAHNAGRLEAAALALALSGACLGFLRYNFNPASIFLGDCGSLLLGFALGTISLLNVTRIAGLTTIIIPLVIATVPILDTFSAIIRRKRAHVGIAHADKGHIHHRLLKEGYNQRQAVLLIYAWTAMLCLGAYVMTQIELLPRIFIFIVLILSSVLFILHLKLFTPVLLHRYGAKAKDEEHIDVSTPESDT